MTITPEIKSRIRLDLITTLLYRSYDKVYGYTLDRACRHPALRDAREKLINYEQRIRAGESLTEQELDWLDWLGFQINWWLRTGELAGVWKLIDGVHCYELIDEPTSEPIVILAETQEPILEQV